MSEENENKSDSKNSKETAVGIGVAFGVIAGIIIDQMTGNPGQWIALGIAIGAGLGYSVQEKL